MATVPKPPIQTFVFFDLEATSLKRPRITELCLLSVQQEEFLTRDGTPRVVNKLTLCVDPEKAISPVASNMTGLYNDSLESQTPFNSEVVDILSHFLSRLPKPVCLVAHYGSGFDYPLLNAELQRAKCELPSDVVCVDSLDAIRTIDMQALYEEERQCINIQTENNSTPTHQKIQSDQGGQPHNSTTPEHQTNNTYTAMVTQETMLGKRKAEAENIEHVKKRLFTDLADKEAKEGGNGENKTPSCDRVGLPKDKEKLQNDNEKDVGQSRATSFMMDSQQSVTDDMLMEAVDFVEANLKVACTSIRNCPSASNVTSTSSSPKTHVMCSLSASGTGNDSVSLPGASAGGTGTSGINSIGTASNNSFQSVQPSAGGTVRCNVSEDQLGTPGQSSNNNMSTVKTGVNIVNPVSTSVNNVSPVNTGVNNVTPVNTSVNNVSPVNTSVNNVSPVNTSVNNVSPVNTGVNNLTPVNTGVNNGTPVNTGVNASPVNTDVNNVTQSNTGVNNSNNLATIQGQFTPIVLPKLSFKLEEIYNRTFGTKPPLSHNAEDDCMTLMKVCKKRCPQFLEWANTHQVALSSLPPMY